MPHRRIHADHAWLGQGFSADVAFDLEEGRIAGVGARSDIADLAARYVLPGMPNLHSHAFQRAMAGLAERQSHSDDSFWTWREVMYAFAGRIGPEDLRAIAAQLYVEMLEAGYPQACEFHYLHHRPDGRPYDDPAAMSLALVEAAQETGIGLTLLPVLYMTGGFDGRPLSERQRRFHHGIDAYLRLLERLRLLESPMLYALGFIGLFTIGGITGLFLAAIGLDIHVHDTYFVIAHFHYVMVGGTLLAYLGGMHYWWPKMTGKLYSEPWAKTSAVIIFVGFVRAARTGAQRGDGES